MKAQIRKEKPFRITEANQLYSKISNETDCYEHGIDTNGHIYFAFINGIVKRYSRREFIKMSRDNF
jgi:hypothetical protein